MPAYNLLDEGWIPCLRSAHAPPELLSIRQVLRQAPDLRQIADPAPTVTAMLHRLLLAILHRSLNGPRSPAEWGTIWQSRAWNIARIEAYLDRFHDRFDLFDPAHPFYQTCGLAEDKYFEINQITHERASDRNRPLLFDHSLPGSGMAPDAAARYLIAQQGFSVSGLFSTNPGEGYEARSTPASPLLKSAVCLATGATVFETLMLNWYQYNRDAEAPFPFGGDDCPAWERDEPVRPIERMPDGWVDLLTWQCRRIALRPTVYEDGTLRVTHAALMQGYRMPASFDARVCETMVAYTVLKTAPPGAPPWLPVSLKPGRAVWRESGALFQSIAGEESRPRTLEWLSRLLNEEYLTERPMIPLTVLGLMPDQARIEDWRQETLPLPARFIQRPELVNIVRRELHFVERLGQLLEPRLLNIPGQRKEQTVKGPSPVRVLAEELLRYTSDRTPDPRAIGDLGRHLSPLEGYWSALEAPFHTFVLALADEVRLDAHGYPIERGDAARAWATIARRAAAQCFSALISGLGDASRTLRAAAKAEARFHLCLHRLTAAHDDLLPTPFDDPPEIGAR